MERKNNAAPRETLLITRFSALGDVCMAIPVIYAVCRANPDIRFVMLTRRGASGMFVNPPENLTVEGVEFTGRYKGAAGALRLFSDMRRRYSVTMMADLHSVLRTHLMRAAARIRGIRTAVIDKCRKQRRHLVSNGAEASRPLPPVANRYARVFESLGIITPDPQEAASPARNLPDSLFSKVTAPRRDTDEKWIGIAPFAAHQGKIYPTEQMHAVIERLISQTDARIFLFGGGKHEQTVLSGWAAEHPERITSVAGSGIGFAGEIALMGQMDVMVAMDSANMHLASLAGIPVISIWGATHPAAGFYGWRQNPALAIQLPMPCRPCSTFGNKPCHYGDYRCLSGITPDMITEKIKNLIYG